MDEASVSTPAPIRFLMEGQFVPGEVNIFIDDIGNRYFCRSFYPFSYLESNDYCTVKHNWWLIPLWTDIPSSLPRMYRTIMEVELNYRHQLTFSNDGAYGGYQSFLVGRDSSPHNRRDLYLLLAVLFLISLEKAQDCYMDALFS